MKNLSSTEINLRIVNAFQPLLWDPKSTVPQLIDIKDVCKILGLKRTAVYHLVVIGQLGRPLKFGKSRRSASRWLLSDVLHFVETLAAGRDQHNS
jgi:predicted DNA-binding transcriptional regulator AlpA